MAEKKVIDDETSDKTKIKMNKINQIGIFWYIRSMNFHDIFMVHKRLASSLTKFGISFLRIFLLSWKSI